MTVEVAGAVRARLKAAAVMLAVALLAGACGDSGADGGRIVVRVGGVKAQIKTERVTRAGWGDAWPFTVDEATLICVPTFQSLGAFIAVDGHALAVTGGAETLARVRKLDVVVDGAVQRPVTPDTADPTVDRLWALASISEAQIAADPSRGASRRGLARKSMAPVPALRALANLGCDG